MISVHQINVFTFGVYTDVNIKGHTRVLLCNDVKKKKKA